MIAYPNAKINLGLWVTEKRTDGFHNIESLFVPVPLCDILEWIPLPDGKKTAFSCSGIHIDCKQTDNLVLKAYLLLKETYPLPPLRIHLHKAIPLGAGLGGGSSDAAFMLTSLNQALNLHIPAKELENLAAEIGSDCPFFIKNHPAMATERGTKLQPLDQTLPNCYLVLVNPGIHVSTKEAYAGITLSRPPHALSEIISLPAHTWKEKLVNTFEPLILAKHPIIDQLKQTMYKMGAFYAAMSGSGSSVFGLFFSAPKLDHNLQKHLIWQGETNFSTAGNVN